VRFPVNAESITPKCPLCGLELVPLIFVCEGRVPPPIEEGDYFLVVEDWLEHHGRWG